jgi:hypothetical protein
MGTGKTRTTRRRRPGWKKAAGFPVMIDGDEHAYTPVEDPPGHVELRRLPDPPPIEKTPATKRRSSSGITKPARAKRQRGRVG